jgi:hypothetical protein
MKYNIWFQQGLNIHVSLFMSHYGQHLDINLARRTREQLAELTASRGG